MNKQMLFGLPIGTKVELGGKTGVLTNASAMEIFKTYEITFDDGEVITRDELIDKDKEEWELIPSEELKETIKKRDWYKSEMNAVRKEKEENDDILNKLTEKLNEVSKNNQNIIERLKEAVDKVQTLTIENVTLTGRLEELTGSETIVIEKGEMKNKVLGVKPFEHSPDVYSSGPVGAPVKLATEIAKLLNRENIEEILKKAGGQANVGYIAENLQSSARAVYRFISKSTGMFVGKLPEPDYKEENADAWLEGQQKVSEPETESVTDAPERTQNLEPSEESGIPPEVEGSDERPEADEGGN